MTTVTEIGTRTDSRHGAPSWLTSVWVAPVLIAVIALALRLHDLGDKPFWLDEVSSLHRATIGFRAMVAESLRSKHYPSYFALLWLVGKLGASQWLLRLPSAIFGAFDAALLCIIGRDADGPRTGFAAGLLMALSPFDIQYGQEARSYTLVAAFILIALWGLVRLAREPAMPFRRSKGGWANGWPALPWLAYGGGTAVALNVLNVAVPWLVAANLAAIAIAYAAKEERRAFLKRWGLVQAIVILLWLPALIAVSIASKGGDLAGPGWAPHESWKTVWAILAPVYLDRLSAFITFDLMPVVVPGLSLLIAAMAAYGVWRLRRAPTILAVIGGAAIVSPLLLLLVAHFTPVLVPRYFAWGAAPFFLLAGAGFARFTRGRFAVWRFGGVMAALLVVLLVNLRPYYKEETKPRWDLAMAQLGNEVQPGDVVLFNDWDAYYVASTYATREGLDRRGLAMTWKPAVATQEAVGHDLFVIFGRAGQGVTNPSADYLRLVAQLGSPTSEEQVGQYITIRHFAAPNMLAAACPSSDACNGATPADGAAAIGKP